MIHQVETAISRDITTAAVRSQTIAFLAQTIRFADLVALHTIPWQPSNELSRQWADTLTRDVVAEWIRSRQVINDSLADIGGMQCFIETDDAQIPITLEEWHGHKDAGHLEWRVKEITGGTLITPLSIIDELRELHC